MIYIRQVRGGRLHWAGMREAMRRVLHKQSRLMDCRAPQQSGLGFPTAPGTTYGVHTFRADKADEQGCAKLPSIKNIAPTSKTAKIALKKDFISSICRQMECTCIIVFIFCSYLQSVYIYSPTIPKFCMTNLIAICVYASNTHMTQLTMLEEEIIGRKYK